ncbi:MAG: potassium transporter TrkG [Deltaproteobacteria bacterium]
MRGTFVVLGLCAVPLFGAATQTSISLVDPALAIVLGAGAVAAVTAGFVMPRMEALARVLILVAAVAFVLVSGPLLVDAPARALVLGLVVSTTLARMFVRRVSLAAMTERKDARDALIVCAFAGYFGGLRGPADGISDASLIVASLAALVFAARYARNALGGMNRVAGAIVAGGVITVLFYDPFGVLVAVGPVLAGVALLVVAAPAMVARDLDFLLRRPGRFVVATFSLLAVIGAVALSSPYASAGPVLSGLDATFTAISAVCVTGLIVVDTPTAFTFAGQATILALIQVGGLGIMALSVAVLFVLDRRVSFTYERAAAGVLGTEGGPSIRRAVRMILTVTGATEGVSALLLATRFYFAGDALPTAIWRGLFTAVSAFCNAGFALQSDSLVPYQTDPFVLHVIALTIIIGGLGPATVVMLPRFVRRERVSLQARLVLVTSALLTVVPALLIGAIEWNGALLNLDVVDRLHNAWFQSVTLRTAGFNSVDFAHLAPATHAIMIVLMLIGGSPGSTAGGIKTTTIAVLTLAVLAALRGVAKAEVGGRRLAHITVYRAAAVMSLGVASSVGAVIALTLTQDIPVADLWFESFSALGTVGLSTGATGKLDAVGKVIIGACMFVGRIGPLTAFLWLADQAPDSGWRLPEEDVPVG